MTLPDWQQTEGEAYTNLKTIQAFCDEYYQALWWDQEPPELPALQIGGRSVNLAGLAHAVMPRLVNDLARYGFNLQLLQEQIDNILEAPNLEPQEGRVTEQAQMISVLDQALYEMANGALRPWPGPGGLGG
jgi:hypothetical protein